MSSSKDIFEAKVFAANLFASGAWRGIGVTRERPYTATLTVTDTSSIALATALASSAAATISAAAITLFVDGVEPVAAVSYDVGDKPKLTATFTDSTGTLFDPTDVSLTIKSPLGVITTLVYPTNITKVSTGVFTYDISLTRAGLYNYRWFSPTDEVAQTGEIIALADPTD